MANPDQPTGFTPLRHLAGGVIRMADGFKISDNYGVALYAGDAVVLTSGRLAIGADNSSAILGVFAGVRYRDTDGKTWFKRYWAANTRTLNAEDAEAFVYVDRNITYRVQSDTTTAYVDTTHKGGKYDIQLDHAGSTYTGQSGMEIDLNDSGTGHFMVLGLIDEPTNAAGTNAKLEVVCAAPLYQL